MTTLRGEIGELSRPALLVHGGAGSFAGIDQPEKAVVLTDAIAEALEAGWQVLSAPNGDAFEAVTAAVEALENSGRFNAGRGAVPTQDGKVEFDASVIDTTGRLGAIAAARHPANPVRLARRVAERGGLPDGPILLAGKGADRFAKDEHLPRMKRSQLTGIPGADDSPHGLTVASPHGTVGAVALDPSGRMAAATSTGGRSGQMRGRIGDTPVFGAGIWAEASTVAVSATGAGEVFVYTGFAHRIDWLLRQGHGVGVAMDDALGHVAAHGGEGGAIAIRPDASFAARYNSRAMARGWRDRRGIVTRVSEEPGPA
jgi:beta-aspartyl-peptidase (threonine type)